MLAEEPIVNGKYVRSVPNTALRQGEIISGLVVYRIALESLYTADDVLVLPEQQPFAIVASQDCDLDWDFKARREAVQTNDGESEQDIEDKERKRKKKLLPNISFCMLQTADSLRNRDNDIKSGKEINSSTWGQITSNKLERYHFFERPRAEQDLQPSPIPELAADFKKYFSLPTDEVYEQFKHNAKRHCRLASPYLEHFSTRFCYYQFRVALPEDHLSESS